MKAMKNVLVVMMMMLFAQLSFAADQNATMMSTDGKMAMDGKMSMDQKMQKLDSKLAETKAALMIQGADQESAWKEYADAVKMRAKNMYDAKMKMKAARQGANPAPKVQGQPKMYMNTAAERLNQEIDFAKTNEKSLEDMKKPLEKLYKSLKPEQQKIADQRLKF